MHPKDASLVEPELEKLRNWLATVIASRRSPDGLMILLPSGSVEKRGEVAGESRSRRLIVVRSPG
jgi:hypothetical protein